MFLRMSFFRFPKMCKRGSISLNNCILWPTPSKGIRSTSSSCCPSTVSNSRSYYSILNSSKHDVTTVLQRSNCNWNTSKCWKCGHDQEGSAVFCKKCQVIQRPDEKRNYFNIIGIDQNYQVELSDLTSKYRKLQNVLHPDRFTNREDEEKRLSEEYSSLVNKAYFTLHHPLKRGLYMLEQKGVFVEEGTVKSTPEFLMEIMEKNEDVDDAKSSQQLDKLSVQNKARFDQLVRELTDAFKSEDLNLAQETLTKMQYYASIDMKIKELKQKYL